MTCGSLFVHSFDTESFELIYHFLVCDLRLDSKFEFRRTRESVARNRGGTLRDWSCHSTPVTSSRTLSVCLEPLELVIALFCPVLCDTKVEQDPESQIQKV